MPARASKKHPVLPTRRSSHSTTNQINAARRSFDLKNPKLCGAATRHHQDDRWPPNALGQQPHSHQVDPIHQVLTASYSRRKEEGIPRSSNYNVFAFSIKPPRDRQRSLASLASSDETHVDPSLHQSILPSAERNSPRFRTQTPTDPGFSEPEFPCACSCGRARGNTLRSPDPPKRGCR